MTILKKHPAGHTHRRIDMNQGPILPNLLRYCIPMMLSGVLQLLFNAADISVAGQYIGDQELAAIGATATLINLLINLLVGLSVGVSVCLGRAYGVGEGQTVRRLVHNAVFLAIACGAVISLVSFFGAEMLLGLMKVPKHLLPMGARYLRIYACGMMGSALFNYGSAVLRATGDIRRPMYCLAVSCGLNFGLNHLFVRPMHMGLEGVALATTISLWVMGLLTLLCMMRSEGALQFRFRELRPHGKTLRRILGIGLPAGLQGIFFPLSNIILQTYINSFGATVIAANSAACNIESFVYQAMNGFYHGCMAFVSCNVGAGNRKRVWQVFRQSMLGVTVTGLVLGLGMVFFGRPLLGIYTPSDDVIEAGLLRFLFTGIPYFLCGMMEVVVGMLRGLGSSMTPMILSVLGVCGVRIAWVMTVFQTEQFRTVDAVYFSYPLSWAVALIAQSVWLVMLTKRLRKKEHIL